MLYCSWDMARVECYCYFSFWGIFSPLSHPTPTPNPSPRNRSKSENFNKMNNTLELSSFNTSVPKIMIICCIAPKIWLMTDVIAIFCFGLFLPFCSPNSPPKTKISIKLKKRLQISSFYTSVPKIIIIYYTVPEIWRVTDVIAIFHFRLFFALLRP